MRSTRARRSLRSRSTRSRSGWHTTIRSFERRCARFDLAGADGQPVVWAARLLGTPIPGRVNGTDLMFELFELAEREGYGVYLLGAKQEALDAAAAELRAAVSATASRRDAARLLRCRRGARRSSARWRARSRTSSSSRCRLLARSGFCSSTPSELGVGFAMGVGGSIDVLAGIQPRAPVWMQRAGLEWVFRLMRDPRGMWRRYLTTNARFVGCWSRPWLPARSAGAAMNHSERRRPVRIVCRISGYVVVIDRDTGWGGVGRRSTETT